MAKKNENKKVVEKAKELTEQAPNDIETQETQTQTDNGEGNETQTSSISTEPTNQGSGDLEATSEENTEMDSSTENEGDGSEGNQISDEVGNKILDNLLQGVDNKKQEAVVEAMYFPSKNSMHNKVIESLKERFKDKIESIAKGVFSKSTAQVLYFTEDLIPFFIEADARKHASEIDAPLVYQYKREE